MYTNYLAFFRLFSIGVLGLGFFLCVNLFISIASSWCHGTFSGSCFRLTSFFLALRSGSCAPLITHFTFFCIVISDFGESLVCGNILSVCSIFSAPKQCIPRMHAGKCKHYQKILNKHFKCHKLFNGKILYALV